MTRIGSLCSGYEGLGMAVTDVLGGDLAWVADNSPGAAAILAYRFPEVPNLGDISVTDWDTVAPVDVLTAGFPCQDVSCAGGRAGLRSGNRTGVWAYVARAIDTLRPSLVVLENVRGLLSFGADSDLEWCPWCMGNTDPESALRAIGAVLGDLADLGFDAEWVLVPASDVGAPHRRERVFILAWLAADTRSERQHRRPRVGRDGWPATVREQAGRDCWDSGSTPAQDADRATSRERRLAAPGQAAGWRPRADTGGPDRAPAPANAECGTGDGGADEPVGGPHRRTLAAVDSEVGIEWGAYARAIAGWERITGRPAPRPTEPGRTGERLSPRFVEWLMGLPEGWVTDVPGLSRKDQLKALGNGVVPQQAAAALRLLLPVLERAA